MELAGIPLPTPLGIDRAACEGAERLSVEVATEAELDPSLVLAGWAVLLGRYCGEETLVIGVQAEGMLLPLRLQLPSGGSWRDWVAEVERQWQRAAAHGDMPLQQIADQVAGPLFESVVAWGSVDPVAAPLVIHLCPEGLWIHYDAGRFAADAIDRLRGHWQMLLQAPDLDDLDILTPAERQQILVEWNATSAEYPRQHTIHRIFAEQAAARPDAVALIWPAHGSEPERRLTYRQLNQESERLAAQLQGLGVGLGCFVALVMERSIEQIIALVAILKAGGVYAPLDPSYPPERLAFMLEDTAAPLILTQTRLLPRLSGQSAQILTLDPGWQAPPDGSLLPVAVGPEDLAYVNYTSGSTGRPKGVLIPHRAVLRLVLGSDFTPMGPDRVWLQLAPISFDAATLEIWGALLQGGCCVLFPGNGLPDPGELEQVLRVYGVTSLWLTASLFNALLTAAPAALRGVAEILTGGEALSAPHMRLAQAQLPGTQLVNGYGPTENTTVTCCHRIPPLGPGCRSIPIGKPIANTQVYVLDERRRPLPVGAVGELYVGGDGLARGYLNRPELTAERFVPDPFRPGSLLYRTGDRVRWLADGTLDYIGRLDNQVKIRGFRIELGEIEAVLRQHPAVGDAVVVVQEDPPGLKHLIGFVTGPDVDVAALGHYLRQNLAEYMLPAHLAVLERLPLGPTGKVDRRALPKVSWETASYLAPQTATERILAEIWGDLLGRERVSVVENFFDLGGSSVLGLELMTRVQQRFDAGIRPLLLYQYPTIRALGQHIDAQSSSPSLVGMQARAQQQRSARRGRA